MLTYFCMLNVKWKTAVFAYKYSKCLDVCASANSHPKFLGAQWLSGIVHEWRLRAAGSSLTGVVSLS